MAESRISPGELFKKHKLTMIKELVRKPNDQFYVFSATEYANHAKVAIEKTSINQHYKNYLIALVDHVINPRAVSADDLKLTYQPFKKNIDLAEVIKYFGEILGPLYIIKTRGGTQVVFPQRSNYELFDYFVVQNKKYVGYSAKAEGGSSNTLVPRLIAERIAGQKKVQDKDLGIDVILQLATQPTFAGTVKAVGLLAKKNIFPATMNNDAALKDEFKKINWNADAMIIETNKKVKLSKLSLSGKDAYTKFLSTHVVPRMKSSHTPATFTATNLIYGFIAMYLADVSKDGAFDLTPTIQKLFPDLNIVKMGISSAGIPGFHLIPRGRVEEVTLRSKARWDVIKDKLGVQL